MAIKVNIFSNLYKITTEVREKLIKVLKKKNIGICEKYDSTADFNIVIGGDGTFIKAVHDSNFSKIPFIGINTGHLGFYNDVKYDEIEQAIEKLLKKEYLLNHLKLIECEIHTDTTTYVHNSINEIVLKSKYSSIINFDLYVDDFKLETFAGDGVIFSTPSGSTAYSLSAGGALLYQTLDAIQITPLAAIRSSLHRSLDKSLVAPKETKIKLITRRRDENASAIGVDGMHYEYDNINHIDIRFSNSTINKIVFDKNWFWNNIKEKFI